MTEFVATERDFDRIVKAIRGQAMPELVLLFGSRADGRARENSDYDLMVVLRDDRDLKRDRDNIHSALIDIGIAADVLVRSVREYEGRQSDPGFLDWLVARSGQVLYSSGAVKQRSSGPARIREGPSQGVRTWIERAAEDFRVADLANAIADPATGAVCFHAHACVEKLLKALLIARGSYPPRTHMLLELLSLQVPRFRDNEEVRSACALLQKHYPGSRYPDEPAPTIDEAQSVLQAAHVVRELTLPLLERK